MRVLLSVAAGLILMLECLKFYVVEARPSHISKKKKSSKRGATGCEHPSSPCGSRIEEEQCSTGCSPILTIANDYVGQTREMLADGMESNEVIEWVAEKVQDTCIQRLISKPDEKNEDEVFDAVEYWQCMAYSEMALRVDPDYALFAWVQEYLVDSEDIDPHAGCGDMVLEVTKLGIKDEIPGVIANLKDETFTIENFSRKNELRDSLVSVPGLIFGAGFLSLLSKGTEIVAAMCIDYADVASFIDIVSTETACHESFNLGPHSIFKS